ncbi:MAG: hypothetical protein R3E54_09955 [Halioglobus sp.]
MANSSLRLHERQNVDSQHVPEWKAGRGRRANELSPDAPIEPEGLMVALLTFTAVAVTVMIVGVIGSSLVF